MSRPMRERREKKVILCFRISGSVWEERARSEHDQRFKLYRVWGSKVFMMEIAYGVDVELRRKAKGWVNHSEPSVSNYTASLCLLVVSRERRNGSLC